MSLQFAISRIHSKDPLGSVSVIISDDERPAEAETVISLKFKDYETKRAFLDAIKSKKVRVIE